MCPSGRTGRPRCLILRCPLMHQPRPWIVAQATLMETCGRVEVGERRSEGLMYTKPRLPDPVRTAAVRALVIVAVTLVQLMIAVLCSLATVWLAFPMVI